MCRSHAMLLGIACLITIVHSAKPVSHGQIKVSYNGQLSSSGSPGALLRKEDVQDDRDVKDDDLDQEDVQDDPDVKDDNLDPETEEDSKPVEIQDQVEDTIAAAQSYDFDKLKNDSKRHVHYTAATSPARESESSPLKLIWNFEGTGPPVPDPAEANIVKEQHAKTLGPTAVVQGMQSTALPHPGCFQPRHATDIDQAERCPDACPLFAEDTASPQHCNFKCVNTSDCGLEHTHTNLAQSVPDETRGFCRRCVVVACSRCNRAAHGDVCAECQRGFRLENGECVSQIPILGSLLKGSLYLILLVPVLYFVAWYVSLVLRKATNLEEQAQALQFRTQTKLCKPDSGDERGTERQLWPLRTNTLAVPVAGPGSVLFFRYQLFIMIWALVLATLWVASVSMTDGSLYALGTEDPESPRELCAVIHRGFEQQRTMMSTKVYFLLVAYIASLVLCISFGIFQQRTFHRLNNDATQADFVALVDGLPAVHGTENLEEILKTELQTGTSQEIVGVSVGWDFAPHAEKITELLESDVRALDKLPGSPETADPAATSATSARAPVEGASRPRWFRPMDRLMLTQVLGIELTTPAPATAEATSGETLAKSLVCSPKALVVFKTESGRDAALAAKKDISFRGNTLQIKPLTSEPMGICWKNFAVVRQKQRERLWAAIKMILLASFAWSLFIYLPFAQYASSFSYSNGDKPSIGMTISLTLIVVLGNLFMYTTCAEAAKRIGFINRDAEGGAYMVLYTFAILLNIMMDAALTGSIAYRTAVGQRARTYGGTLIADLTRAQAIFESFELQRQLGLAVFKYCWPAMYLVPFIGEAVGANWFTLHLARLVVASFPHIKGFKAQQAMKVLVPMDPGRYADVLINITAGVLIFFLPGGYTLPLLVALILSHVFIILFDHFRVLRCVPSFCFSSSVVDDYAQKLLILPCALIMAAFILKSNCTLTSTFCVQDSSLGLSMLMGGALHVGLHWWALQVIVPKFGNVKEHVPTKFTYEQVASLAAPSWFNLNPAYCLRSKYFYKHETPCYYLVQGREHVLRKNDKAMSFFEDQRRVVKETYGRFQLG